MLALLLPLDFSLRGPVVVTLDLVLCLGGLIS